LQLNFSLGGPPRNLPRFSLNDSMRSGIGRGIRAIRPSGRSCPPPKAPLGPAVHVDLVALGRYEFSRRPLLEVDPICGSGRRRTPPSSLPALSCSTRPPRKSISFGGSGGDGALARRPRAPRRDAWTATNTTQGRRAPTPPKRGCRGSAATARRNDAARTALCGALAALLLFSSGTRARPPLPVSSVVVLVPAGRERPPWHLGSGSTGPAGTESWSLRARAALRARPRKWYRA